MATEKSPKIPKIYHCELCDLITSSLKDYTRHLSTLKHQKRRLATNGNHLATQKIPILMYQCEKCNKNYCDKSGLWRHNKKCNMSLITQDNKSANTSDKPNYVVDKELVMLLIKENSELKNMMMEVIKTGTHNTINNHSTHTNSHNKTFNLQFFLNETCKNAMNIMDFVDSLTLQLNDLEKMGEIGFVNGMSNIIIKNLQNLDVTERPVHCTDKKRDILYVKDNDKWNKETEEKPKIRKAIKHAAHKNAKLLLEFKEKHPDCIKSTSKHSDMYNKLMIEAMGGNGDNCLEKENKIIRNMMQEVILEKEKGIFS